MNNQNNNNNNKDNNNMKTVDHYHFINTKRCLNG